MIYRPRFHDCGLAGLHFGIQIGYTVVTYGVFLSMYIETGPYPRTSPA